ncbi:MAG: hypothetical protein JJ863_00275 [Deltaproteobacteria bacterium]|nr:hypothetical protein [Deltaproteobacteria bacterium]
MVDCLRTLGATVFLLAAACGDDVIEEPPCDEPADIVCCLADGTEVPYQCGIGRRVCPTDAVEQSGGFCEAPPDAAP